MEICTLHEAVCMEAGWLSKQAGFFLVVRMEKNQPGSRDEIIYVIIQVGINEQAYCTFKNITRVYLCYNFQNSCIFTVTTTRCHVGFRKSKKKTSPGKGPACLVFVMNSSLPQTVGRLLANSRPTVGQLLADSWPTGGEGSCSSQSPHVYMIFC